MLVIHGYLHDFDEHHIAEKWIRSVRKAGWTGTIHGLSWQASSVYELVKEVGSTLLSTAVPIPGPKKLVNGAKISILLWRLINHWKTARNEAEAAGQALAKMIIDQGVPDWARNELHIAGYSLGTRVAFHALDSLGSKGNACIENVHLYGGALSRHESWSKAIQAVRGSIRNNYCKKDMVLQSVYRAAEWHTPIGLTDIDFTHPRISNRDVTEWVSGHLDYESAIGDFERYV